MLLEKQGEKITFDLSFEIQEYNFYKKESGGGITSAKNDITMHVMLKT